MPTYRCTGKILKEMGAKPVQLPDWDVDDWHANLVRVGPKKLVLFCSSSTLYSFVTPPVTRAQIKDFDTIFFPALEGTMNIEGYSDDSIAFCRERYSNMGISKTNDKSVLGTMTDYLYHIDSIIWHAGGIERCNFNELSARLNAIPQVKRDFSSASDAFKKSLIRGVV